MDPRGPLAPLVVAALLVAACEEPDASSLRHGARTTSPSTEETKSGGAPSSGGLGSGPQASGAAGSAAAAQAAANAKSLFDALAPELSQNCGNACHTDGVGGAPAWLGGADHYVSIKAYKGIVVPEPKTSLLLTKGTHEGPALPDGLATRATAWLEAEAAAIVISASVKTGGETSKVPIAAGAMSIDLPITPGGKVTFTADLTAGVLSLKTLTLVAPATGGVHAGGIHLDIAHADGSSSRDDSLSGADSTAAAGKSSALGIGLVVVPRIGAGDQIGLSFDVLEAATGAGTTTATLGGCKDVTSFQTNAAPAIQQNTCLNCHNTGGSGNGALDLSGLAANPPTFTQACGQAKSKIDTTNVAQSPIILAPTGGIAAHPFKNASAQFTTMMTTWINAEK